jgi:hypothetical protein
MKKKEIKKMYSREMSVVDDVIETLSELSNSSGPYTISTADNGVREISREEFLETVIEWTVEKLAGNVGYIFLGNHMEMDLKSGTVRFGQETEVRLVKYTEDGLKIIPLVEELEG